MSAIASIDLSAVAGLPLSPYAGQAFGGFYGPQQGSVSAAAGATTASDPVTKQPAPRPPQPDQVQLSKQAEARLLRSQGESLAEIEATLAVGESTVTSYLGITNGTQTLVAAATAAVETQAAQSAA
jgi:hypothetical protein